ncbi:phosphomannomutase/phosphoglucomutase [Candidatus Kuenenbacteria bacterium]|nr:phosphomannomutase/phosphoglucomutase [Candidatus Kuenenbacteria bacterium]
MEIFRAYDIRGEYGKDIDDEKAYKIVRILVKTFNVKTMVIGRDVSLASPKIQQALIRGARDSGVNVTDIGHAGTDVVYFCVGHLGYDLGLEVTASHSAGHLSGIKILGPGARPFGAGCGMEELKNDFLNYQDQPVAEQIGTLEQRDIWPDFIETVLKFTELKDIRPMKIVIDASNSVGAIEIDKIAKHLPQVEIIKLNWELDGYFPGHQPNPFLEENRRQLVAKVKETKADLGMAFDGDADRVYFVDGNGDYIFGVYLNALIAERMLKNNPGRVVLYDIRAYRYQEMKVKAAGGVPKLELVGHAFIKKGMRRDNAIFAGESSGHVYYSFGDYYVENSLIAFIQILQIMSETGKTLEELTKEPRKKYPVSGEWNFSLPGFAATDDLTPEAIQAMNEVLDKVREKYADGEVSDFDTLTVKYPDWNFNIRPSANDPVIRFTAEANEVKLLIEKQNELINLLKETGCQYVNDSGVKQPE